MSNVLFSTMAVSFPHPSHHVFTLAALTHLPSCVTKWHPLHREMCHSPRTVPSRGHSGLAHLTMSNWTDNLEYFTNFWAPKPLSSLLQQPIQRGQHTGGVGKKLGIVNHAKKCLQLQHINGSGGFWDCPDLVWCGVETISGDTVPKNTPQMAAWRSTYFGRVWVQLLLSGWEPCLASVGAFIWPSQDQDVVQVDHPLLDSV